MINVILSGFAVAPVDPSGALSLVSFERAGKVLATVLAKDLSAFSYVVSFSVGLFSKPLPAGCAVQPAGVFLQG